MLESESKISGLALRREGKVPQCDYLGVFIINIILFHASFNPKCCLWVKNKTPISTYSNWRLFKLSSLQEEKKGTICFCNFLYCYWVLEGESNLVKRLIIIHVQLTITQ